MTADYNRIVVEYWSMHRCRYTCKSSASNENRIPENRNERLWKTTKRAIGDAIEGRVRFHNAYC